MGAVSRFVVACVIMSAIHLLAVYPYTGKPMDLWIALGLAGTGLLAVFVVPTTAPEEE